MKNTPTTKQIDAAAIEFKKWSALDGFTRAKLLQNWADLILENKAKIVKIINGESGKLPEEAATEVELSTSYISWSAEEAKRISGEVITMPNSNFGMVLKQPIGVVGAITPWNFPAAMIARKTAPALAAGCTVVIKPSPETPKTAVFLVALAHKAGIAENAISVVTGDAAAIGKEFCTNPKISKISFTGSSAVGKILMSQCSGSIKKLTLELGGNAPFIVFSDADIDAAVTGAIKSRFRNSGQTCICANRFLVHEKIYDEFARKLTIAAKKLKLAPLINQKAVEKVAGLIASSGGKILTGGKFKKLQFEPTVIVDVPINSKIFATEIFGPVATIFKFKTASQAIELANKTEYGLAAFIYSGNMAQSLEVAKQLDFGMIGINDTTISAAHSPFGGMKESGIGREGSHYGIDEYLEKKYVNLAY